MLCSLSLGATCACDDVISQTSGQTKIYYNQLDMAAAFVLLYYGVNATTCTTVVCVIFSFFSATRCGSAEDEKGSWITDGSQRREGTFKASQWTISFLGFFLFGLFVFAVNLMLCWTLQDRKIDELKQSLLRYKKVQDMVMSVQAKKGEKTHLLTFCFSFLSHIIIVCCRERQR